MAVRIEGTEIEYSETEYGFRVIGTTDEPVVCDTKEDAEFHIGIYPNTELVMSRVFYSPWVKVN